MGRSSTPKQPAAAPRGSTSAGPRAGLPASPSPASPRTRGAPRLPPPGRNGGPREGVGRGRGKEGAGPLLGEGRRGGRAAQPETETSDPLSGSSSRAACCSFLRAAASRPVPRGRRPEGCWRAGDLPPSPLPARSRTPASPGARAPAGLPVRPGPRSETPGAERR